MKKITVETLLVHPMAQIPEYQTDLSAGFDLMSCEDVLIMPGDTCPVNTGLSFAIPENWEIQVRPRSGLSLKTGLRVSNSPGTIDSDYRGVVKVILQNTGTLPYTIKVGDRIAQGVLNEVPRADFVVVEKLNETKRGSGGFGSTGV